MDISTDLPQKSLDIFGNLQLSTKYFRKWWQNFIQPSDSVWRSFETLRKSSQNCLKLCISVVYMINKIIRGCLEIFLCSTRYWVEHWKRNFISLYSRVSSSVYRPFLLWTINPALKRYPFNTRCWLYNLTSKHTLHARLPMQCVFAG